MAPGLSPPAGRREDAGLKVLVLGDRLSVALPACRALARAGHVVGVATTTRTAPVLASRAVTYRHLFPDREAPQEAWARALDRAVVRCCYDAVLACEDIDVVRLLAARPRIASVPSMAAAAVLDKAALARVCADVGVAYPRTFVPASAADDATIADAVAGRAVVKAAQPAVLGERGVVHVSGATAATDRPGVIAAIRRYRAAGVRPLVQEPVVGPKLQAVIIRRDRRTSCRLAALVERATPGEATLRQLESSLGLGGECIAALERVADGAGYEGLLQAELIAPPSGGVYLIDLNPRLWGGLSFAELIGLRMTERVLRDAFGLPMPPPPEDVAGRRYHHVAREAAYVARSPREAVSVLSAWSRGDVWDAPRRNDLRPHLLQAWRGVRQSRR